MAIVTLTKREKIGRIVKLLEAKYKEQDKIYKYNAVESLQHEEGFTNN